MSRILERKESEPLLVHLHPAVEMSDREFFELCRINRDLRFERTAKGDLLIMPPTGGKTGRRNNLLAKSFLDWEEADGTGITFDSSTGFILPNGAKRAPNVAWVLKERLAALTNEQRKKNSCPYVPRSSSNCAPPPTTSTTCTPRCANTSSMARLALLIDPQTRRTHAYRSDGTIEVRDNAETFTDEVVLPGLVIDLRRIWDVDF
ncbi:MAG: Uma2 family endonuclease [Pyrinomonadaceae bacterium MAG19_C2-C3]|nr:Uma2 family endonuclease [Pyrinomonadaceae bacterium MAG19_C2-C3]